MLFANIPSGIDDLDFTEGNSAKRIGHRIRTIRKAKGLSQGELGQMVGLSADRIQKYENGARKPKSELLKKLARALGVNSLALADPTTASYIDAMFTLFDLEKNFNMKLEKSGTKLCLSIDFRDKFYSYINEWYKAYTQLQTELEIASSETEIAELMKEYDLWKWSYPQPLVDKTSHDYRKAQIKDKIDKLQELYNELDNNK